MFCLSQATASPRRCLLCLVGVFFFLFFFFLILSEHLQMCSSPEKIFIMQFTLSHSVIKVDGGPITV